MATSAVEVAAGYVSIYASITHSEVEKAVNDAMSGISGNFNIKADTTAASGALSGLAGIADGMGNVLTAVGVGVTAVAKKFGAWAMDTISDSELMRIAMTQLTGSTDKAKQLVSQLSKVAIVTPFNFATLQKSAERMLALGFSADEVVPSIQAVGDAVAATGGTDANFQNVIHALGLMRSSGKVTALAMNAMARNNIASWDMLAEHMGKTVPEVRKMVTDGEISAEEGISAIIEGANKRYSGMMVKASSTLSGILSNMEDAIQVNLMDLASAPGYEQLKKSLQSTIEPLERLTKSVAPLLDSVMSSAAGAIQKVSDALQGLSIQPGFADELASVARLLGSTVILGPGLKVFARYLNVAGKAIDGMGTVAAVTQGVVQGSFKRIQKSISGSGVIPALKTMASGAQTHITAFGKSFGNGLKNVAASAKYNFRPFYDQIHDFGEHVGQRFLIAAGNIIPNIKAFGSRMSEGIKNVAAHFKYNFRPFYDQIHDFGEHVGQRFLIAAGNIIPNIKAFGSRIGGGVKQIGSGMKEFAAVVAPNITAKVGASFDATKSALQVGIGKVSGVFKSVGSTFSKASGAVKGVFTSAFGGLKGAFGNATSALRNALANAFSNISAVIAKASGTLEGAFGNINERIGTIFRSAQSTIVAGVAGLGGKMRTAFQSIANSKLGTALRNVGTTITGQLYNTFSAAGSRIAASMSSMVDPIASKFQALGTAAGNASGLFAKVGVVFNQLSPIMQKVGGAVTSSASAILSAFGKFANVGVIFSSVLVAVAAFGAIVAGTFVAAGGNINDFATTVFTDMAHIAEWINTGMQSFTAALPQVTQQLTTAIPMLLAGVKNIVDTVVSNLTTMLPQLTAVVTQIATGLGTMIAQNAPAILSAAMQLFAGFVQAMADTINNLTPQMPVLIQQLVSTIVANAPAILSAAVNLFTALVQAFVVVAPELINGLITLIQQLVPILAANAPQIAQGAMQLFLGLVQALAPIAIQLLQQLPTIIQQIVAFLAANAPAIAAGAVQLFVGLVQALAPVAAQLLVTLAQLLVQIVTSIIGGAGSLLGAAGKFFLGLVTSILQVAAQVIANVASFLSNVVSAIAGAAGGLLGAAKTLFTTIVTAIGETVSKAVQAIANLITNIIDKIKGAVSNMLSAGKSLMNGLHDGISNGVGTVTSFVGGIPGKIVSALGNVGGILSGAGRSIMDGFLGGLKSAYGAVQNFVSGVAGWVKSHKGPIDYDRRLLIPNGMAIMEGLAAGMQGGFSNAVVPLVLGMSGEIARQLTASPALSSGGMGLGAGIAASRNSEGAMVVDWLKHNLGPTINESAPAMMPREFARAVRSVG